jgi:methylmalonyl-CoA mutase
MAKRDIQHLNLPLSDSFSEENFPENTSYQHNKYGAGFPPFVRGVHTTMYVQKPWTIRQYSGFSSAKESNQFYKKNLAGGQTGLSLAFDLPTHRGYDSDHPRASGDVGKTGVAIDTVEDMKILFKDIPLDEISVSMTMNGAVLPIMAFYIVAAEETGVLPQQLSGTLQNDILKEFMVRNAFIYPPKASLKIVGDILEYATKNLPKFNPISISGYHMQEAGATPELELAFTIANGLEYVRESINRGLSVDDFAPHLSFFWGIGMNHFTEIAKLRAARYIWAHQMKKFNPKNEKSLMLRAHCQTSGWTLTEQDPYNNITRTTLEALSAILGGTQSLHTNSYDEAIGLPTLSSAKIARNTQLILREESKITKTVDPLAGNHQLEKITDQLIQKITALIEEIENMGGMTKAIENGFPNQKIEEAALIKQCDIENGKTKIIGLNSQILKKEKEHPHLTIDLEKVKSEQINRLQKIKSERDEAAVKNALNNIVLAAQNNTNLLSETIKAARLRATLGEISEAIEKVYGRYHLTPILTKGVYKQYAQNIETYQNALQLTNIFFEINHRKPKILMAKLGQDGHDRGLKAVASGLYDIGFEVNISELFLTPKECAEILAQQAVDAVGISILSGGHLTLIPELIEHLPKQNTPKIFVGGIIPKEDYTPLYEMGVSGVFGPGYPISLAAQKIINQINTIQ